MELRYGTLCVVWIQLLYLSHCVPTDRETSLQVTPIHFFVLNQNVLSIDRTTHFFSDGENTPQPVSPAKLEQINNNFTPVVDWFTDDKGSRPGGNKKPTGVGDKPRPGENSYTDGRKPGNHRGRLRDRESRDGKTWARYKVDVNIVGMADEQTLAGEKENGLADVLRANTNRRKRSARIRRRIRARRDGNRYRDRTEADAKIIGGSYPGPYEWPWLVSIQFLGEDLNWYHTCGGSLIQDRWVVTAAHCVSMLEGYTVRLVLGDYQLTRPSFHEQIVNPATILLHSRFDNVSYYYDIALLKLERRAVITTAVKTIGVNSPATDAFDGDSKCFISGWGNSYGSVGEMTISDYIRQGKMNIITNDLCKESYGDVIIDSQICIESETISACSGDSGGPFICHDGKTYKLVGLASYVGSASCEPGNPNVYTRISAFYSWISDVIDDYTDDK